MKVCWFKQLKNSFILLLSALIIASCSEAEPQQLRIAFAGDVLLDRGVREQIERHSIESILQPIAPVLQGYDAVVANLECPVTKHQTPINKRFVFRGKPEWLPALHRAGFTHWIMANNHTNDQGRRELTTTANHIAENQMKSIGYGPTHEQACRPVVIEKNGIRVAVFASVLVPLETWMFVPSKPSPCQASAEELAQNIAGYKQQHPNDFVVVVLHWGREYAATPQPQQRQNARRLLNAGATAIVGHHPHVVQTVEIINGQPVFYSIGNFIFDQNRAPKNQALLVELTFGHDTLLNFSARPVVIRQSTPQLMPIDEQAAFKQHIETISALHIETDSTTNRWFFAPASSLP